MPNLDAISREDLVPPAFAWGLLHKQAVYRDESPYGRLYRIIGGPYLETYGGSPSFHNLIESVFGIKPVESESYLPGIIRKTYYFRPLFGWALIDGEYEGNLPYKALGQPEYIKSWLLGCSLADNHFAGCSKGITLSSRNPELTAFLKEAAAGAGYKLVKEEKRPYKAISKYAEYGLVYLSFCED